jgi:hypothetical protein
MSITVTVNEQQHEIKLTNVGNVQAIAQQSPNFFGEKLHHPFKFGFRKVEVRPGREVTTTFYESEFVSDEIENELKNATSFQIKHDGSCGYVKYDDETGLFKLFARYDVPFAKKKGDSKYTLMPAVKQAVEAAVASGQMLCCEALSPEATHWPHFRDCEYEMTKNCYVHYKKAFETFMVKYADTIPKKNFTCEFMGKQFCLPQYDQIQEPTLVVHGAYTIDIPVECRTFEGINQIMQSMPYIEGLVVYGPSKTMKIRREMFADVDGKSNLKWSKFKAGMQTVEELYLSDPEKYNVIKDGGLSSQVF